MTAFTLDQVRTALQSVVADFGPDTKYGTRYEEITGYTYEPRMANCQYQVGGTPACIVGVVLDRLGVDLDPYWDQIPTTVDGIDVPLTEAAVNYLYIAQAKQDDNFTWGYALDAAEESVRN